MTEYIIYFKQTNGKFRCYNPELNKIEILQRLPNMHRYEVSKGYDATDEGLRLYAKDFKQWCKEILFVMKNGNIHALNSIEYTSKFPNHNTAIIGTFKRYCKNKYEHHDPIEYLESTWMESCHNGGLTFCKEEGDYESYGYDFSSFFPRILSSKEFLIPDKQGDEYYYKKLPKKIKLGFYRCKITSTNPDVKKIFSFSKKDTYTSTSLSFAIQHKEQFNINIEMIIDDKPNAYIYESYVTGDSIFGLWFDRLFNHFKKRNPKNKLVKGLLSQVWGQICQKNLKRISYDDMIEQNLSVSLTGENSEYKILNIENVDSENEYYELQNVQLPYKYNLRIKCFLLSYSRNKIANIALRDINNVIRIQTDNVVFKKEQNFNDVPDLTLENKTSGVIHWKNVNKYYKI
jgi:hypothetical protein